jgi:hypothetical protein
LLEGFISTDIVDISTLPERMLMKPLHSLIAHWRRLKDAARSELLRNPDVLLFERHPQSGQSARGR